METYNELTFQSQTYDIKKLSAAHRSKISISLSKLSATDIQFIRKHRDEHSIIELANLLNISKSSLYRALKKHKIKLSLKGKKRARINSTNKQKNKKPWNKGIPLSEETKKKISQAVSGEKNGQYGRGMTEQEKHKWKQSHQTAEIHKTKAYLKSSKRRKSQAKAKKTTQSSKFRTLCSDLTTQRIANGWRPFANHKQEWVRTKKGGRIFVKSSWEKKFSETLDEDKKVLNFQYEPMALRYNYKGGKRNYYPDFLVRMKDGSIVLYEVKPKNLINYGKNKPKAAAGRRFCRKMGWSYKIITEDVLFN